MFCWPWRFSTVTLNGLADGQSCWNGSKDTSFAASCTSCPSICWGYCISKENAFAWSQCHSYFVLCRLHIQKDDFKMKTDGSLDISQAYHSVETETVGYIWSKQVSLQSKVCTEVTFFKLRKWHNLIMEGQKQEVNQFCEHSYGGFIIFFSVKCPKQALN